MSESDDRTLEPPEADVLLERVLHAPRTLVWRAFTNPAELAAWFGPEGSVMTARDVQVDLRPGGGWSMQMRDADGGVLHRGRARILALEEPWLLVTEEDWAMAGLEPATLRTRIELTDAGEGRTRLRILQGPHGAMRGAAIGSWEQSLARLETLLAA